MSKKTKVIKNKYSPALERIISLLKNESGQISAEVAATYRLAQMVSKAEEGEESNLKGKDIKELVAMANGEGATTKVRKKIQEPLLVCPSDTWESFYEEKLQNLQNAIHYAKLRLEHTPSLENEANVAECLLRYKWWKEAGIQVFMTYWDAFPYATPTDFVEKTVYTGIDRWWREGDCPYDGDEPFDNKDENDD